MATGRNGRNNRRRRFWIWMMVAVAILAGAIFAVRAALQPDTSIDPNRLAEVTQGHVARSVVATGKIQPRTRVEVKSKASGIVQRLLADCGDWVHQGEVLVELDKEELSARVREARALLAAAEAAEESAKAAHERNQVEAEGPDLPFLKSSMDRARKLHGEGLIAHARSAEARVADVAARPAEVKP